ncbi:HK97 family phage prohead protease [Phytomonospora endophytica]|uniref:HK97 family phage prohead protease n=1 Tax=Phytomonospora endophytica TaxID=714109 RepID=A0A841FU81_9ACTN|nr:HK97 family phage prohead protease [Phytomonospora endophytica]MBB6038333.1 HK97 family phage prohead protease [Phytomonospora endophytica]
MPYTPSTERRQYAPRLRLTPALELSTSAGRSGGPTRTRLEGLAVPYGRSEEVMDSWGWYRESIAPGAFKKSITEAARALPLLLSHSTSVFPIGRAIEWDEQPDGLYGVWELDSAPQAQEAARLADEGMMTGLSVQFMPLAGRTAVQEPTRDGDLAHLTHHEARLLEVSLCATPAYADAGVTLVRSFDRAVGAVRPGPQQTMRPVLEEWRKWRDGIAA